MLVYGKDAMKMCLYMFSLVCVLYYIFGCVQFFIIFGFVSGVVSLIILGRIIWCTYTVVRYKMVCAIGYNARDQLGCRSFHVLSLFSNCGCMTAIRKCDHSRRRTTGLNIMSNMYDFKYLIYVLIIVLYYRWSVLSTTWRVEFCWRKEEES